MIVIGRLHIGAIQPEWLIAWEELQKPTSAAGAPEWVTYTAMRQVVHLARNDIVRYTLQQHPEATHLFFLDDDILLPPDGLLRLLRDSVEHDIPVVSGLYIMRNAPLLPVVYRRLESGHHVNMTAFCEGLQEIDACGAGCLLIRTDVLRAIEATSEPWFDFGLPMSEDLAFCARAKALGYRIALDAEVKCRHLSVIEITYDYFAEQLRTGIAYASPELAAASQDVRPWEVARPIAVPPKRRARAKKRAASPTAILAEGVAS